MIEIPDPSLPGDEGGDVTTEATHDELVAGDGDRVPHFVDSFESHSE